MSGLSVKCLKTQRLCTLLSQDLLDHLPLLAGLSLSTEYPFRGLRGLVAFVLVISASGWHDTFGWSLG